MVDTFKTKYEALEIPYPSDQGTLAGEWCLSVYKAQTSLNNLISAIDAQNAEMKVSYEAFIKEADAAITEKEAELAKWTGMKCVSEMNLEEALDAGLVGTTIKGIPHPDKPTFWPHLEVRCPSKPSNIYVEELKLICVLCRPGMSTLRG